MAEYTKIETARAIICDFCNQLYSDEPCEPADCDWLRMLEEDAADVAPVVHGRWDDSGRYTFPSGDVAVRCTNCGCALTESEYHLNNWNYCPVCGDKMDGGADNG